MKKIIISTAFSLVYTLLSGQVDLAYPVSAARGGAVMGIANDWEAIGINPSNLGWADNHKFSITIFNFGVNAQSDGLSFKTVQNIIENKPDSASGRVYAHNILGAEKGLNVFADVNWLATSFRISPLGGTFALSMRDRVVTHVSLGPNGDKVFGGNDTNSAQVMGYLNGTTLTIYHYREVNLAFGRELFEYTKDHPPLFTATTVQTKGVGRSTNDSSILRIFGGVGLKYLMGLAYASMTDQSNMLYANYSVMNSYPSAAVFPKAPGSGFGLDLGLSAIYRKWKFGLSASDLGFIRWRQNFAAEIDTNLSQLDKSYTDFVNHNVAEFQQTGDFTMGLPAKLRLGANYMINKFFSASSDVVIPLNNAIANLPGPYAAIAGQMNLSRWFILDLGFAYAQEYGISMPASVSLGFGRKVHMYFGTNDILTFLGSIHNPALSVAFGLVRVDI